MDPMGYTTSVENPNWSTSDQLTCKMSQSTPNMPRALPLQICNTKTAASPFFLLPLREQPTKLVNVDPSTQRKTIPRISTCGALRVEAFRKRTAHSVSCTRGILPCRHSDPCWSICGVFLEVGVAFSKNGISYILWCWSMIPRPSTCFCSLLPEACYMCM